MVALAGSSASSRLRVAVAAGEASGDLLGADLIKALRARVTDVEFVGIAGPHMVAAGCESWYRTEDLSVMGLAEILKDLPRLLKLRRDFISRLRVAQPDIFIGIDAPDFNLPVGAALRKLALPSVQYVSPQVWAWRQSRVKNIRKSTDLVLCVFPFETSFYEKHNVNALFVGHPIADQIPLVANRASARAELNLPAAKPILAILPGSRISEVSKLARPFLETGRWLQEHHPGLEVVVALSNEATRATYKKVTGGIHLDPAPRLTLGRAREVLTAADIVLTASGTASLEAALLKRPMVVAYIISGLTHQLFKLLGLNKLEYFSLPNLLAGFEIVPEFLQRDVQPVVLGSALQNYLAYTEGCEPWPGVFEKIHLQLRQNASDRAADAVLDLLGGDIGRH